MGHIALQEVTKNRHVHYFQCCSRNLFSEGMGKAVITRYDKLQRVTRCYKNRAVKGLFRKLHKSSFFFLKEVINCYNVLQQATMRSKKLQKIGMRTTFNVAQRIYFLMKGEGKSCYNMLQQVTMRYKRLQK